MKSISYIVAACRPKQWPKNVLIFSVLVPAAYLPTAFDGFKLIALLGIWILASSGVYLLNDVFDFEVDRSDPERAMRPIASGKLPLKLANVFVIFFFTLTIFFSALLDVKILVLMGTYLSVSLLYSMGAKHIPVVEMLIIASGFCLRAVSGGLLLNISISHTFIVTIAFIAMFIVSSKRFAEKKSDLDKAIGFRPVLKIYTENFLKFTWTTSAAILISTYIQWSTVEVNLLRTLSIFPLLGAILIYALDIENVTLRNPERVILKDFRLLACLFFWALLVILASL